MILDENVEPMVLSIDFDRYNGIVNSRLKVGLFYEEVEAWTATGPVFLGEYSFCHRMC